LGPHGTAATNRPIVPAPVYYDDGELVGMIDKGNGSTRRKREPNAALSTTNPICCPDANPGRCGGKPSTNGLSYGTAMPAGKSPKWSTGSNKGPSECGITFEYLPLHVRLAIKQELLQPYCYLNKYNFTVTLRQTVCSDRKLRIEHSESLSNVLVILVCLYTTCILLFNTRT
jgi:hypothetical protein